MLQSVVNASDSDTPFVRMFLLLFGETLAGFLGCLVTIFFGFHIWLMLKAMTTIEFCEKSMKRSSYDASAYDRGALGNIKAVLGDEVWLWLLPVNPPSGSGSSFATEDMRLLKDVEVGRSARRRAHRRGGGGSDGGRRTGSAPGSEEESEGAESGSQHDQE